MVGSNCIMFLRFSLEMFQVRILCKYGVRSHFSGYNEVGEDYYSLCFLCTN